MNLNQNYRWFDINKQSLTYSKEKALELGGDNSGFEGSQDSPLYLENKQILFMRQMEIDGKKMKNLSDHFYFEYDRVKIRSFEDRFNCGGDNTLRHIGTLVYYQDKWQIHVFLNNDYAYLSAGDYYVDALMDNYTIERIAELDLEYLEQNKII